MEKTREDRTKNKPKEVHREVSNGKNTRGQDKTEGWEMGSSGTNKAKKNEEKGGRGGAGGGRGGRGREEGGQQNSKTTELQRGSRKAKARERNIRRKGSGAGPGGAGRERRKGERKRAG